MLSVSVHTHAEGIPVFERVAVAGGDTGREASVHAERHDPRAVLSCDIRRSVRRPVVDDEHIGVRQLLPDLVEDGRKVRLLVPGREEDKRVTATHPV